MKRAQCLADLPARSTLRRAAALSKGLHFVDEFGGYRPLLPPARAVGNAAFVGLLCLTALLERLQYQLRGSEASRWWASNGRDVVNAFALAAMTLGLRLIGFTGPISLLIAATVVLLVSAAQGVVAQHRFASWFSLALTLALGLPILLAPSSVHSLFRRALGILFLW